MLPFSVRSESEMSKKYLLITLLSLGPFNYYVIGQSHVKILTEGEQPKFNPSGTKIVYTHNGKVWVMNANGKHKKRIGRFLNEKRPAWNPDGKKIVFQSYGRDNSINQKFQIWIMNTDGSSPHPLLDSSYRSVEDDQRPLWSPDGKQIVFSHGKQIWIADTNGRNARPLTKDPAKIWEFVGDWSPDGQWIAYLRVDEYSEEIPQAKIWLIKSNGDGQRQFMDGVRADGVKWSKDGKFLFYSANCSIWKINIEGSESAQKIVDLDECDGWDISKNEQWIIYDNAVEETDSKIFLMQLKKGMRSNN
jgi:Tol biopolymer transport system component